ncbi:MAG TPA: hypothetical protein PLL33_09030 [Paracoccus sp. (in: a-proteobacteria)]|nr:hypothetical protein [Paracoccus sp. (in: a-proteobacteria)]
MPHHREGPRLPPALAAALDDLGIGGAAAQFVPPPDVTATAAEGLALRARHGRGGTEVGLARAQGLAASRPLTAAEMRMMAGWFARFGAQRRPARWGDPDNPSTGYIAWMLWGGDAGRNWVEARRADWS